MTRHPFIFQQQTLAHAPPEMMDVLWAQGWRHFGCEFFRYSLSTGEEGEWQRILPLRIDLAEFEPTKNQRRVIRRNADTEVRLAPAQVNEEREAMFLRHRARFTHNIPENLRVFLASEDPAGVPCECRELQVWQGSRLLAVSFLDIGAESVSSVYGMFEPDESKRSLGIFTMLMEIEFARSSGRRFLYPGYATVEPSHYDYKKQFAGLQAYDWHGNWHPLAALPG